MYSMIFYDFPYSFDESLTDDVYILTTEALFIIKCDQM